MTKVEEVARAIEVILALEVRCGQDPALPADDQCKTTWLPYKRHCPECPLHYTQRADVATEMARAAIEAMRAPTPEITKAVCETLDGPNKDKARARIGAWLEAHHAAIDAALAEGPLSPQSTG